MSTADTCTATVDPVALLASLDRDTIASEIATCERRLAALRILERAVGFADGSEPIVKKGGPKGPRKKQYAESASGEHHAPQSSGQSTSNGELTRQSINMKIYHFLKHHGPARLDQIVEGVQMPTAPVKAVLQEMGRFTELSSGRWKLTSDSV